MVLVAELTRVAGEDDEILRSIGRTGGAKPESPTGCALREELRFGCYELVVCERPPLVELRHALQLS